MNAMRLWVLSGLFLFLGGCLLSFPVKGSDSAGLEFLFPPQWSYEPDSGLFFLEIAPRNESGINSVRVFGGPEWKEEMAPEGRIVEKECREACFWMIALDVSDRGRRRKTIEQQRRDALFLISRLPGADRVTVYALEKGKIPVCVALAPKQAAEKLGKANFNGDSVTKGVTHLYKNLAEMTRAVSPGGSLPKMKALLVCSDGRDELEGISGLVFQEELERQLRRLEMTCHCIGYMESGKDVPFTEKLVKLAEASGGSFMLVDRKSGGEASHEELDALARFSRKTFRAPFRLSGVKGPVKVTISGKSGKTWTGEYSSDEFDKMAGRPVEKALKKEVGLDEIENIIRRILAAVDTPETGKSPEQNSPDALYAELASLLKGLSDGVPERLRREIDGRVEHLEECSAFEKGVTRLILHWMDLLKQREEVTVDSLRADISGMADSVKKEEEEKEQMASVLPESSMEDGFLVPEENEGKGGMWIFAAGGGLVVALAWAGFLVFRTRGYPVLVIHNRTVVQYPIKRAVTRIGKNSDNDCVIDHESVSRVHCMIRREDAGRWTIADLQSANGVFVNNRKIVETELHDGDRIELGDVVMTFRSQH